MRLPDILTNPLLTALSWMLHRAPFKTRLGGISTLTARALGLNSRTETRAATLQNGIKLPVQLSDYNGRMLYLFGTPDPKVVCVCETLLREGDVFLDIGANYGTVGLLAHKSLGQTGSLHFVEPQPQLCAAINGGIEQASIPNASVHNCGIWDEDGELTLRRPSKHTGAASFAIDSGAVGAHGEESFQVPVRSIESFLHECVGDRSFGAKVDVEGAEPRILPTILSHPALRFLLFECNIDSVREHAWQLTAEKKIVFFGLSKHLFRIRLHTVTTKEELARVHDVLAVRMNPDNAPRGEFHPDVLRSVLQTSSV